MGNACACRAAQSSDASEQRVSRAGTGPAAVAGKEACGPEEEDSGEGKVGAQDHAATATVPLTTHGAECDGEELARVRTRLRSAISTRLALFTFAGCHVLALCETYYDGDTTTVAFDLEAAMASRTVPAAHAFAPHRARKPKPTPAEAAEAKRTEAEHERQGFEAALHAQAAGRIVKYHLRLAGIDAPELKPLKSEPHRELHIRAAQAARDALARYLGGVGALVYLSLQREDKYGRLLGTVFPIDPKTARRLPEDASSWMLRHRFAKQYGGGAKTAWTRAELQVIVAPHPL